MPIRKGAVTFARFRLSGDHPKDTRHWLTKALKARAFEPIDPKGDEDRAAGFVELENDRATDFGVGNVFYGMQALFSWRVEKLRIPQTQIRAHLLEWATNFEKHQGRAPGRREKAEEKDHFKKTLRTKTEPSSKVFDVSLDLSTLELLIWGTARTIVDELTAVLEDELKVKLVPRVPAAFAKPNVLDSLEPTPELFGLQEVKHAVA